MGTTTHDDTHRVTQARTDHYVFALGMGHRRVNYYVIFVNTSMRTVLPSNFEDMNELGTIPYENNRFEHRDASCIPCRCFTKGIESFVALVQSYSVYSYNFRRDLCNNFTNPISSYF